MGTFAAKAKKSALGELFSNWRICREGPESAANNP